MNVKITANTGRGIAHPKNGQPTPEQTYQDAGGAKITVHSVQFNRVAEEIADREGF
ncbi:hypothetical protein [Mixta mediterraneensis]|uniref:hypothetical protein n=1 Tax=Mixta mediterraneensis TaxID=2758443 RepID=UPI001875462C|nr:hypothetical protein [Mixta mediterraneensis]MBE5252212.1 hypothetical protein [Mixta mediterraneensis]